MCQRMLRLPSRTNSRPTRMEALLNPLRTGIILLEHMNDNAEASMETAGRDLRPFHPRRVQPCSVGN